MFATLNNTIMAKTAKQHQDLIDKRGGVSYHNYIKKEDPEGKGYAAAYDYAKTLTDRFMVKVRDHNQPGHEQALNTYLNQYSQNEKNVHADSISTACNLLDAVPPEIQNMAYEGKILDNYKAFTPDDEAFISKFRTLCRLKIKAEGYCNMAEFVTDFWDKHPLSPEAKASAPKIIDSKQAVNLVHPAAAPGFDPANPPDDWRVGPGVDKKGYNMSAVMASIAARTKKNN